MRQHRTTGWTHRWASRRGAVVVAVLLAAACGGSGPDLEALKNDPLSGIVSPDAQLVDRFEQPRSLGSSGDKANPAQIILSFAVRQGVDERTLLGAVARTATEAGRVVVPSGNGYAGSRNLGGEEGVQPATAGMEVSEVGSPPRRLLVIVLTNPSSLDTP